MNVNVADPESEKRFAGDESHHFLIGSHYGLRQVLQGSQNQIAISQAAQCQFSRHKRVSQHLASIQESPQFAVALAQVVYPNRRIHQNHAGSGRRRGTSWSKGSDPPSEANRLALSRSINALSASRTNAVFSIVPVKD
jgi:hypothetical protein